MSAKLTERCEVLARIVRALKPIYSGSLTPTQKDLIETMIGAAIWYLPQSTDLWTGKISVEAIKAQQSGGKVCKDHNYPRKIAGRELLAMSDEELNGGVILRQYTSKYGVFNKVTPAENKTLMKYQRGDRFTSPEDAYRLAGVELVDLNDSQTRSRIESLGKKVEAGGEGRSD
jgi:hypothetical protein